MPSSITSLNKVEEAQSAKVRHRKHRSSIDINYRDKKTRGSLTEGVGGLVPSPDCRLAYGVDTTGNWFTRVDTPRSIFSWGRAPVKQENTCNRGGSTRRWGCHASWVRPSQLHRVLPLGARVCAKRPDILMAYAGNYSTPVRPNTSSQKSNRSNRIYMCYFPVIYKYRCKYRKGSMYAVPAQNWNDNLLNSGGANAANLGTFVSNPTSRATRLVDTVATGAGSGIGFGVVWPRD